MNSLHWVVWTVSNNNRIPAYSLWSHLTRQKASCVVRILGQNLHEIMSGTFTRAEQEQLPSMVPHFSQIWKELLRPLCSQLISSAFHRVLWKFEFYDMILISTNVEDTLRLSEVFQCKIRKKLHLLFHSYFKKSCSVLYQDYISSGKKQIHSIYSFQSS